LATQDRSLRIIVILMFTGFAVINTLDYVLGSHRTGGLIAGVTGLVGAVATVLRPDVMPRRQANKRRRMLLVGLIVLTTVVILLYGLLL
jgi:hypothetical protein